jgi:hypothetical protein
VNLARIFYAPTAELTDNGYIGKSQTPQIIVLDLNVGGKIVQSG